MNSKVLAGLSKKSGHGKHKSTSVLISEANEAFLEEHGINLSAFVREKLNELEKKYKREQKKRLKLVLNDL